MVIDVSEVCSDLDLAISDLRADILALHLVHCADSLHVFDAESVQRGCDTLIDAHMSYMVQHFQSVALSVRQLFVYLDELEGIPPLAPIESDVVGAPGPVLCPRGVLYPPSMQKF